MSRRMYAAAVVLAFGLAWEPADAVNAQASPASAGTAASIETTAASEQATAAGTPLDRAGLLAAALAKSPTLATARRDLDASRDKAWWAASIWQSGFGLTGQYKETLTAASGSGSAAGTGSTGASTAASATTNPSATASLSVKPFEFLGLDASLDTALNYKASLSLKPFASTSQSESATQAWEDQRLRHADTIRGFATTVQQAWAKWAKAQGDLELAGLARDSAESALAQARLKNEAGALSMYDLDKARADALQAAKTLNDATVSELGARYDLLILAGLDLAQPLASPTAPDPSALRARAAAALAGQAQLAPDLATALADLGVERARANLNKAPGFLTGLSAGASLGGSTKGLSDWQATLGFSTTLSSLGDSDSATKNRALENALQAQTSARNQRARATALAGQRLQGALAVAETATLQAQQANTSLTVERTRHEAGASSNQKLADAALSALRAELTAAAAWRDLETELLSWDFSNDAAH